MNELNWNVKTKSESFGPFSLNDAMLQAKAMSEFVTITDGTTEFCGMFGVDTVENGKCPDGVAYTWNKTARIGKMRKKDLITPVVRFEE